MSRRWRIVVVASLVVGLIVYRTAIWSGGSARRSPAASGSGNDPLVAASTPGQIAPVQIGEHLSPDAAKKVTAWSPKSVIMPAAKPGETAPVRQLRIGQLDPTEPGPPPNPFVPPKQRLTPEEMGMSPESSK